MQRKCNEQFSTIVVRAQDSMTGHLPTDCYRYISQIFCIGYVTSVLTQEQGDQNKL